MRQFLRFLRGLIGITAIWAATWGAAWALLGAVSWFAVIRHYPVHDYFRRYVIGRMYFGILFGAVSSLAFSLLLALTERYRDNHRSLGRRGVLFGGVGGLVVGAGAVLIHPADVSLLPGLIALAEFGLIGVAAGSLTVRIANHDQHRSLESGAAHLEQLR
ncbi:MAG TPA: hypothetical protein VGM20_12900 [Gemmatimonadales bacterium]|jgi:hypothetical protein